MAAVACAAAAFFAVSALDAGHGARHARAAAAYAVLDLQTPHVESSYETYTVSPGDEGPSRATTVMGATAFAKPIAAYRRYAEAQLALLSHDVAGLRAALASGERTAAEASWRTAFTRYLRLGAVYTRGRLGELGTQIDGTAGGLQGGPANPSFAGLHRIEYGLWTGAPTRSLVGVATRLGEAVTQMRAVLPTAQVEPTEYVNRAHEVLEDALRDLLSGTDVPWSGEGVTGTAAGLAATEELLSTLSPLLHSEDSERAPVGGIVEGELVPLREALHRIAAEHGGRLPANSGLTQGQAERLQGALGGALEALAEVPVALEAEAPPKPLRIPPADARIEP